MIRQKQPRRPAGRVVKKKKSVKSEIANEVGFIGKALRGLGSLGGSTLGSFIGAPIAGSAVGSSLGAAMSKWLGAGDYAVGKNTLVQRASANIPMMHNTSQSVLVRHREFIGTINGSTGFVVQKAIKINPGLVDTFPWLARIAQRFQEYEFKGMVYHYVPTSGTFNGSTAALGTVMMQTTYRSTDTAPANKIELLNEYNSNETVPFETMVHPIECDPKENPFAVHYIRSTGTGVSDQLLYDLGTTFVATQGMSTTDVVGDLWCTYEVELKKPLISSPVVVSPAYFGCSYAAPSTTDFFGGATAGVVGTLPITATGRLITIPARGGSYLIQVNITSVAGVTAAATLGWSSSTSTVTNCGIWAFDGFYDTTRSAITGTNPVSTLLSWTQGVTVTDPTLPATILLPTWVASSGTTAYASLMVMLAG